MFEENGRILLGDHRNEDNDLLSQVPIIGAPDALTTSYTAFFVSDAWEKASPGWIAYGVVYETYARASEDHLTVEFYNASSNSAQLNKEGVKYRWLIAG